MRVVKKIMVAGALLLTALAAIRHVAATPPAAATPPIPARADLAESVLTMIVNRAAAAGLPHPITLCEACAAAHLDLPEAVVRDRCRKACGLE